MGRAYFVVRAVVGEADRDAFDTWYEKEHLPDAVKAFSANRAWRAWNKTDPSVHVAFYEFDDVQKADAIQSSDAIKGLIAEFDKTWGGRVQRSREIIEVVGEIEG